MLFTRRATQRLINESVKSTTPRQRRKWVSELNREAFDPIATQWEIAVVSTLGQVGNVHHEPDLGGTQFVDVVFSSKDDTFGFAADVVAVSDRGIHENNPVAELDEEVRKKFRQTGLDSGGFYLSVHDLSRQAQRGAKKHPVIPRQSKFNDLIFNEQFDRFVEEVRRNPTSKRTYHVARIRRDVLVRIHYDPDFRGYGGYSAWAFSQTTMIDRNPLFNALRGKVVQLEKSGYFGLKGIVCCDGGSRIFSDLSTWEQYSAQEVVFEFLKRYENVSFVLTLSTVDMSTGMSSTSIVPRLYCRSPESWTQDLSEILDRAISLLPKLVQTAANAREEQKIWHGREHMRTLLGTIERSTCEGATTIRMSSRALLDLLSGRLSQSAFHERIRDRSGVNIFESLRVQGSLITSLSVETRQEEDDDVVTIVLGRPDPAISRFQVPQQNKNSG